MHHASLHGIHFVFATLSKLYIACKIYALNILKRIYEYIMV